MMVTLMFTGMAFCLPLSYLEQWLARRRAAAADPGDASKPLLDTGPALDVRTLWQQVHIKFRNRTA